MIGTVLALSGVNPKHCPTDRQTHTRTQIKVRKRKTILGRFHIRKKDHKSQRGSKREDSGEGAGLAHADRVRSQHFLNPPGVSRRQFEAL